MKRTRLLLVVLGIAGLLIAYLYWEDAKKGPRSLTYSLPHVNGEVTMLRYDATDLERIQNIHIWKFRKRSFKPQTLYPQIHFVKDGKEVWALAGIGSEEAEVTLALVGDWTQSKTLTWVFMTASCKSTNTIENPFIGYKGSVSLAGNLIPFDPKDSTFSLYGFMPTPTNDGSWREDTGNRVYMDFGTVPHTSEKQ